MAYGPWKLTELKTRALVARGQSMVGRGPAQFWRKREAHTSDADISATG